MDTLTVEEERLASLDATISEQRAQLMRIDEQRAALNTEEFVTRRNFNFALAQRAEVLKRLGKA